jgi:CheY-like chemotaxis protein
VDDDAAVRRTLEAGLRASGYQILQAKDGDEALAILSSETVDLVLTDIAMPRRAGLETIIEIRRRFPAVQIIALSGVFSGLCMDMAQRLGAAAALSKPVRFGVLRQTVHDVLAAGSASKGSARSATVTRASVTARISGPSPRDGYGMGARNVSDHGSRPAVYVRSGL